MNNPVEVKKEISQTPPANNTAPKPAAPVESPTADVNINVDPGINLIPTLSKDEVVKEEKKKKLNISSIVSLLILVIVSIIIVGFNIISKMELNAEKENLQELETATMNYSQTMISSNEITSRALLYKQMEGKNYSPKLVLDYLNNIAKKSGSSYVTNITLGNDLTFAMNGNASSLGDVSKFWYLLSNDKEIKDVSLKNVGSSSSGASFTFEGKLILSDFLSSSK